MKKLLALSAATVAAVVGLPAGSASAAPYGDCPYPYVCLYEGAFNGGHLIARYGDPYYQNLHPWQQNRADSVVNTRNDDSVWLLDTGSSPDRYICIPANSQVNLGAYTLRPGDTWANDVDTIRIWLDNGTCSGTREVRGGAVPDGWRG